MRNIRIYHPETLCPGNEISLEPQASTHISRVLRLKEGTDLILFNGDGNEYPGTITSIHRNQVAVRIEGQVNTNRESPLNITLAQGISKGERMDYAIQKAVELGVTRIIPVFTERSVVKLDEERLNKKYKHWQGVIISACEQCGRNRIPELMTPGSLASYLDQQDLNNTCLVLDPEANITINSLDTGTNAVTILIGPEGGFTENEIRLAKNKGFTGIHLGPRILRTETAAVAAIASIQTLWGDFSQISTGK
jgi:16S rRNA (uracil1498-N3)-methyltransferase